MPIISDSGLPQPSDWPEFRYHLSRLESREPGAQISAIRALDVGVAERPELGEMVVDRVLSIFDQGRFDREALDPALCLLVHHGYARLNILELAQCILQSGMCADGLYSALTAMTLNMMLREGKPAVAPLLQSILLDPSHDRAIRSFAVVYSSLERLDSAQAYSHAQSILSLSGVREHLELLLELPLENFDGYTPIELAHCRSCLKHLKDLADHKLPDTNEYQLSIAHVLGEHLGYLRAQRSQKFSDSQVAEVQRIIKERSSVPREWIEQRLNRGKIVVLALSAAPEPAIDPYERLAKDLIVLAQQGTITHLAIPSLIADQAEIRAGEFRNCYDLTGGRDRFAREKDRIERERTERFLRVVQPHLSLICYYGNDSRSRGAEIVNDEEVDTIMRAHRAVDCRGLVVLSGAIICSRAPLPRDGGTDRSFFGPDLVTRAGQDSVKIALYLDQSMDETEKGESAALRLSQLYERGAVRGSFAIDFAETPFATLTHPYCPDAQFGQAFDVLISRMHGFDDGTRSGVRKSILGRPQLTF